MKVEEGSRRMITWQNSRCCSFLVRACGSSEVCLRSTSWKAPVGTIETSPNFLRAACSHESIRVHQKGITRGSGGDPKVREGSRSFACLLPRERRLVKKHLVVGQLALAHAAGQPL